MRNETRLGSGNVVFQVEHLGRVRLGSIRNKDNWNNASKRLSGSYSHSGIPGFPFRNIFRNIFLFRNIPNERALKLYVHLMKLMVYFVYLPGLQCSSSSVKRCVCKILIILRLLTVEKCGIVTFSSIRKNNAKMLRGQGSVVFPASNCCIIIF